MKQTASPPVGETYWIPAFAGMTRRVGLSPGGAFGPAGLSRQGQRRGWIPAFTGMTRGPGGERREGPPQPAWLTLSRPLPPGQRRGWIPACAGMTRWSVLPGERHRMQTGRLRYRLPHPANLAVGRPPPPRGEVKNTDGTSALSAPGKAGLWPASGRSGRLLPTLAKRAFGPNRSQPYTTGGLSSGCHL